MILGLDISTTTTAFTILDTKGKLNHIEAVRLNKIESVYEKSDRILEAVRNARTALNIDFTRVIIEAPLFASNNTFTVQKLAIFNGMISGLLYDEYNVEPEHVTVTNVRKKFLPEYVFKGVLSIPKGFDKKSVVWGKFNELNPDYRGWTFSRTGKLNSWCLDMSDSYAVAYYAL